MTQTSRIAPIRSLCLASAVALTAALAGSSAQAQTVLLTAAPAGASVATTTTFPVGDSGGFVQGPVQVAAGATNVTFTATNAGKNSFESFTNFDGAVDFPLNTVVLDTFDSGSGNVHNPTGPLLINFSSGVSAFGLNVESSRDDTATFSFTAYNGAVAPQNIVGQYTLAPVTQTEPNSNHHSIFLGAQTLGTSQITNVVISDISNINGYTAGSNDFYFGPLSTYSNAPVPEASTTVSFGLLLMLGLGGALLRKKTLAAKASAA